MRKEETMDEKGTEKEKYSEISTVESQHDELIPEEFPEGSFGSPINSQEPVESKSTPWEKGQKRKSAFIYEDKDQHDDLPRRGPRPHPLHDE